MSALQACCASAGARPTLRQVAQLLGSSGGLLLASALQPGIFAAVAAGEAWQVRRSPIPLTYPSSLSRINEAAQVHACYMVRAAGVSSCLCAVHDKARWPSATLGRS